MLHLKFGQFTLAFGQVDFSVTCSAGYVEILIIFYPDNADLFTVFFQTAAFKDLSLFFLYSSK